MALETQTFTYTILDGDLNEEVITEDKVVLPPTKSTFSRWYNSGIYGDPYPAKEMVKYKGRWYTPEEVKEEYYEDWRREGDEFTDERREDE